MAKIFIRLDGCVEGLYTDIINLQILGRLYVKRASNVEFNVPGQSWEVSLPSGEVIYSDGSREAALDWERTYCENCLTGGFRVEAEIANK